MIIGYAQLCAADVEAWYAGATAWRQLAERLDDQTAQLDATTRGLAAAWRGEAADAAGQAVAGLRARIAACRWPVARAEQVLAEHAAAVGRARTALVAATTPEQVAAALRGAQEADARTAAGMAELGSLLRSAPAAAAAAPPVCPPGGGPAAVRVWWGGLTPAQRQWLLERAPEQVGALDGVPAADRDLANRELLRREQDRLTAMRDSLAAGEGGDRERERIERRLAGLAVLADRLGRTDPRPYLLGVDTGGDGRAIVALGDPDRADNVMTFVPGMNTRLDGGLGTALDRTAAMGEAALRADPARSTSAVLWLGYDAPDTLWEAASARSATEGRQDLHDFQEGLAAAHEGTIGQQTLIGHSYGALVIGETARDLGVRADDLVFLGAPGVGVPHVSDLHVDPATVWAASADNDVVGLAAPSVKQFLLDQVWPRYMGDPMADLWHGHNPADEGFGGHVLEAADDANPISAHLGYWKEGNPALTNVGMIAAGHDDRTTRV